MSGSPNVLLITADHMRHDALACNGNPFVETPNLDRLAARGVTFANSFTPNPICVPARAAITTGNYPHVCTRNKNNAGLIQDDQPKIAQHFADCGYATMAVGKLHYVPYAPPGKPRLLHGFQYAELCEEGRMLAQFDPHGELRGVEDYHDYLQDVGWGGYGRAHATGNNDVHPAASPVPAEHHVEAWVAGRSVATLTEHLATRPDQPFFMWSSFIKPHAPYDPPYPYNQRYDPREIPSPTGSYDLLADRDPMLRSAPAAYGWDRMSPEAIQVARAHFYGLVTFQDEMIGRIIGCLEAAGVLDNTIIAYTSDHGDLLGDFGCFFKSNMFDGSVRVPRLFAGPGVAPRADPAPQLVGHQDMLPTLCDLTGNPLDRPVMGVSLAEQLGGSDAPPRELYVSQCLSSPQQRYMVRTDRWKYVYHELGGIEELYDVAEDPGELRNLAGDKPPVVAELRGALIDWCRENGDVEMLEADSLKVAPEDAARVEGFQAGRMGWRWY